MNRYTQSETSIYTTMVESSRYLEINLLFNIQSLVLMPPSILEACSVIICKRLNNKEEARIAESILNLSSDEQLEAMMDLKPVDAIFIDKERTSKPLHILIPKYPTQQVLDERIEMIQAPFINRLLKDVVRAKSPYFKSREGEEELSYQSKFFNISINQNDLFF